MLLGAQYFQVTTGLLILGGCFVAYTRLRNWLDSNIPLLFYTIMLVYARALDGRLSPWGIYTALLLALMIRFEFMNTAFTRLIKLLELGALSVIITACAGLLYGG